MLLPISTEKHHLNVVSSLPSYLLMFMVSGCSASSLGLHFDCSSGWEVKRAMAAGVPPESLCLRYADVSRL